MTAIKGASAFYAGLAKAVAGQPISKAQVEQIQSVLDTLGVEGQRRITYDALERANVPRELRAHVILQALQRRIPNLNLADVAGAASEALKTACSLERLEKDERLVRFFEDVTNGPSITESRLHQGILYELNRLSDPAIGDLETFKSSNGEKMQIGVALYHPSLGEHLAKKVHHDGAIEIAQNKDGSFAVKSYNLEGKAMETFDHATLVALEEIGQKALAKAREPGSADVDGSAAAFLSRFVRTVQAHKSEVEARWDRLGALVDNVLAPLRGLGARVDKEQLDRLIESLPATQIPAPEGLYPQSADHQAIVSSLAAITKPKLGGHARFLESGGTTLRFGTSTYNGEPHHYGAIDVQEEKDGTFKIDAWRLSGVPMKDYDHGTLVELERLTHLLLAETAPPADPAIAVGSPRVRSHEFLKRFLSQIEEARSQIENGEELQKMRPFLALDLGLHREELRELIRRGVTAPDLERVKAQLPQLRSHWDPSQTAMKIQAAIAKLDEGKGPPPLGAGDVRALAEKMAASTNGYEASGAQVALALIAKTDEEKAKILEDGAKWGAHDRVPIIVPGLVARALIGDTNVRKEVFSKGLEWAHSDTRYMIIGGLGLLAASSTTSAEKQIGFDQAKRWTESDYIDLSGLSLPRAAILARAHQRSALFEKAKTSFASKYWDISAGGLVAMALTAEKSSDKRDVFDAAKKELASDNRKPTEAGVLAMALSAQTDIERQEAMRAAKAIVENESFVPAVRIPAMIAMSIAACEDVELARRAVAATIDG
jgi:hypothetical protein